MLGRSFLSQVHLGTTPLPQVRLTFLLSDAGSSLAGNSWSASKKVSLRSERQDNLAGVACLVVPSGSGHHDSRRPTAGLMQTFGSGHHDNLREREAAGLASAARLIVPSTSGWRPGSGRAPMTTGMGRLARGGRLARTGRPGACR